MFRHLKVKSCAVAILSSALLAFGLYHVHAVSGITEGGTLGMTLFLQHWLGISPAYSEVVLNLLFFLLAWRLLGNRFVAPSIISTGAFCIFYKFFEQFDPIWPSLANKPLLAAVLGAVFVGLGSGFCLRMGGAPGGDDAFAMSVSHLFKMKIQWAYLILDVFVLALSATYIPIERLGYSLLTVVLSGQIIGWVCRIKPDTPLDIERIKGKQTAAEYK